MILNFEFNLNLIRVLNLISKLNIHFEIETNFFKRNSFEFGLPIDYLKMCVMCDLKFKIFMIKYLIIKYFKKIVKIDLKLNFS